MINILIGVPSPRDIEIVENCLNVVKYDKIYAKYMDEPTAYHEIREFFLKNKKYTHLAISPDDMLVTPIKVHEIVEDLEKHNFKTLSGWSNNTGWGKGSNIVSHSKNLPPRSNVFYDSYSVDEWKKIKKKFVEVGFSGFPFQVIRRDVVKKIPFDGLNCGGGHVRAFDVGFAHSCHELGIPLIASTRTHFIHLKGILKNQETSRLMVGIKKPKMLFVSPNTS